MKASLINIRLTSKYSAGSYAFAVKDFVHYFRRLRSSQVHNFMAALTCLRSVETNLTLTCPSPKSFVCNLPDSERHVTSVFQCLSLSLSLSLSLRRAGRKEPWERGWYWSRSTTAWSGTTQRFAAVELLLSYILVPIMRTLRLTSSVALSRALANRSWVNVRVMLWCRKTSNYFQLLKVISRFPGFSFLQQHLT